MSETHGQEYFDHEFGRYTTKEPGLVEFERTHSGVTLSVPRLGRNALLAFADRVRTEEAELVADIDNLRDDLGADMNGLFRGFHTGRLDLLQQKNVAVTFVLEGIAQLDPEADQDDFQLRVYSGPEVALVGIANRVISEMLERRPGDTFGRIDTKPAQGAFSEPPLPPY